MQPSPPIQTVHLFPVLDKMLIELLESLTKEEWFKPTIAKRWLVKDIATHLLDTNIRTLSLSRDRHSLQPTNPINSYQELVDYLNELNAIWVNAYRRVSPELLTEFLRTTGKQFSDYLATLEPYEEAIFSVAWAGEQTSKNWFHVAREYTEKYLHQLQIREAVSRPGLMTRELFFPFIDTLMQALPYTYRNTMADIGTVVKVTVTTDIGGDWYLEMKEDGWKLSMQEPEDPKASLEIDPVTSWKLFSKGMSPSEARDKIVISGNEELATVTLQMLSVMA